MEKIGLIGGGFQHAYSTTLWKEPKYFEWAKGQVEDITFVVDNQILWGATNVNCKRKFAWLVESRAIIPQAMNDVRNNVELISNSYELLFTHSREIYELADNFIYLPPHGYWIEEPKIYPKTKLVSMISSSKKMSPGHYKRLTWVDKFRDKVDLYGRGFREIEKKEEGLCDYMFSIVIENDCYETYWSEKILDCFATGTVPVYYGAPDIGKYFNMDGIILLNDDFDISMLNQEEYEKRAVAIKRNMEVTRNNYNIIEDIIYNKFLRLCYCGKPVNFTDADCVDYGLCKEHEQDI